jgi:hypothetical protein
MSESGKKSHWHSLAEKLGAEVKPDAPKPIVRAVTPPPPVVERPKAEPAAPPPKPRSGWSQIASALGVSLPQRREKPKPAAAPVEDVAPVQQELRQREEPAPEPRREEPHREDRPQRPWREESHEAPVARAPAAKMAESHDHDEMEDEPGDETTMTGDSDNASTDETSGEGGTREPGKKSGRRRRRRGRGGRKGERGADRTPQDQSGSPSGEERSPSDELEDRGDLEDRGSDDRSFQDSEMQGEDVPGGESIEGDESSSSENAQEARHETADSDERRPKRRRRRRGGRKSKGGRERLASSEPSSGERGPRAESPDDEEDALDPAPSGADGHELAAEHSAADDHDDSHHDDDLHDMHGDEDGDEIKHGHRGIPTWDEAIGVIVAANMESRARNPNAGSSPRGRGRGNWGRGKGRN